MNRHNQVRLSIVFILLLFSSLCVVIWTQPTLTLKQENQQLNSPKSSNQDLKYTLTIDNSSSITEITPQAKRTPRPTATPKPTPTPTPTSTPKPTASPTPTPSPTPKPTATPTPKPTATPTPKPTATPTPKPTATPTPTPKPTPTLTPSPKPTASPTPTPKPSPTPTPIPTASPTPTSTPTATSIPTATPTPTPTLLQTQPLPSPSPTPTHNPTPTPLPTSNPSASIIPATTDNGATVNLTISGNITSSQISNLTITTNQSATSTAVTFTITGKNGTSGQGIITVPKFAIPYGTEPILYIDNELASDSGFLEDTENFYVWFNTEFSTHQMTIQFDAPSTSQFASFGSLIAIIVIVPEIILVYSIIAVKRIRRKPDSA